MSESHLSSINIRARNHHSPPADSDHDDAPPSGTSSPTSSRPFGLPSTVSSYDKHSSVRTPISTSQKINLVDDPQTLAEGDHVLDVVYSDQGERNIRFMALLCACTFGIGSHYAAHMVGPLKDVLKENLHITNAQFSLLQSSLALFPTILPLLGGLFIEKFGTGPSSILFSSFILLGQIMVLSATYTGSVMGMIVGFMVFGVGAGPIVTVQETILINFFHGSGLGFALALGLASGKIASFLASFTAFPLTQTPNTGFHTPFIFCVLLCGACWCFNICYLFLLRRIERFERTAKVRGGPLTTSSTPNSSENTHGMGGKGKFSWRDVFLFSDLFWAYLAVGFLFGGVWQPFMHLSANVVKHRYAIPDLRAAFYASVVLAIPVIVYPFLGLYLDRYGRRMWILTGCALCLIFCFTILLLPNPLPPLVPLLFFGVSVATGPLTLVSSVPLLTTHIPTGLGLHKSLDYVGATLMGTLAGVILDVHAPANATIPDIVIHHNDSIPGGTDPSIALSHKDDDLVVLRMFLAISFIALLSVAVFWWGDISWRSSGDGGRVNRPQDRKKQESLIETEDEIISLNKIEGEDDDESEMVRLHTDLDEAGEIDEEFERKELEKRHTEVIGKISKRRKIKTFIYIGILGSFLVTSWIFFATVVLAGGGNGH